MVPEEFHKAVASFRESAFALNGSIGRLPIADHTLRARGGATARDVFGFCYTFRRLYEEAHAELRAHLERSAKEFAARPAEDAEAEEWDRHMEAWLNETREEDLQRAALIRDGRDATTALTLGFKVLYFFLRAHQDSLCALAHLALFPRGTRTGDYNMSEHLNRQDGPVGRFIRYAIPDYEPWYWGWRNARNRVKEGVTFATYGTAEEMGIRFTTFIPEGGGTMVTASEGVGLSDVIQGLRMSERLHNAIAGQVSSGASSG